MKLPCAIINGQYREIHGVPKKIQLVAPWRAQVMEKPMTTLIIFQLQKLSMLSAMPLFESLKVQLEVQKDLLGHVSITRSKRQSERGRRQSSASTKPPNVEKPIKASAVFDGRPQVESVDFSIQSLLVGNGRMLVALNPSQLLEP